MNWDRKVFDAYGAFSNFNWIPRPVEVSSMRVPTISCRTPLNSQGMTNRERSAGSGRPAKNWSVPFSYWVSIPRPPHSTGIPGPWVNPPALLGCVRMPAFSTRMHSKLKPLEKPGIDDRIAVHAANASNDQPADAGRCDPIMHKKERERRFGRWPDRNCGGRNGGIESGPDGWHFLSDEAGGGPHGWVGEGDIPGRGRILKCRRWIPGRWECRRGMNNLHSGIAEAAGTIGRK